MDTQTQILAFGHHDDVATDRGGRAAAGRISDASARASERSIAHHIASRSKRRQIRRLKVIISLLVVALVVFAVGWILAWATLKQTRRELAEAELGLAKTQRLLDATRSRLAERDLALADLIENRIPGLRKFETNKLVEVGDKYFLNVTFSETGVAQSKALEYHAVLVNHSEELVLPRIEIGFFDDRGLQVGTVALDPVHATTNFGPPELAPGETRSYHARIDMVRDAHPAYFDIRVD